MSISYCSCVCAVCGLWLDGRSQAHELAMIHAGVYSKFIYGTMCWCKGVCIFTLIPNVFFTLEKKGRRVVCCAPVWNVTVMLASRPARPVSPGLTWRISPICENAPSIEDRFVYVCASQ